MRAVLAFWGLALSGCPTSLGSEDLRAAAVEILGDASLEEIRSRAPELPAGTLREVPEGFESVLQVRFPLLGGKEELFYANVSLDEVPALLRGRFSAQLRDGGVEATVRLNVISPSGSVALERLASADEFEVRAGEEGVYSFHFSTGENAPEASVSLSMGRPATTDPHLSAEHADDMRLWVQAIETDLSEIQTESALIWIRKKSHMDNVDGIWNRVFCFCLVQLIVIIGIQCFIGFYIKGLFDDQTAPAPKPRPEPRRSPSYDFNSSSRSRLSAGRKRSSGFAGGIGR